MKKNTKQGREKWAWLQILVSFVGNQQVQENITIFATLNVNMVYNISLLLSYFSHSSYIRS